MENLWDFADRATSGVWNKIIGNMRAGDSILPWDFDKSDRDMIYGGTHYYKTKQKIEFLQYCRRQQPSRSPTTERVINTDLHDMMVPMSQTSNQFAALVMNYGDRIFEVTQLPTNALDAIIDIRTHDQSISRVTTITRLSR